MQTIRIKPTPQEKRKLAKVMRNMPTPGERRLWWQIKNKRLGVEFKTQVVKCGYILDFGCKKLRIAVEVDGSAHFGREEYDRARDDRLRMAGWKTLRFSNEDVFQRLSWVVGRICEACGVNEPSMLRAPTTRQKRKLGVKISGWLRKTQVERAMKVHRQMKAAAPVFDPAPRLRKA